MTSKPRAIPAQLFCLLLACAPSLAQQPASGSQPLLEDGPPGSVLVNTRSHPDWLRKALDAMAARHGRVVIRCGVVDTPRVADQEKVHGHRLQLPDSVEGMQQLATLGGLAVVELSDHFLLCRTAKGRCDEPLTITAQMASGIGAALDPSLDAQSLGLSLFRAVGCPCIGPTLAGSSWDGVVYWASREGEGRELYVLSLSTEYLSATGRTSVGLSKVVVERLGAELSVRELWSTQCGGRVAQLELDFDRDGVVDVVGFSGDIGSFDGRMPLVVYSGATGKTLGEIDGPSEVVITESPEGYRIRTQGWIDDMERRVALPIVRTYRVKDKAVVLEKEERGTESHMPQPLVRQGSAGLDWARFAASERLAGHFTIGGSVPGSPGCTRLGAVGGMPSRDSGGRFPTGVNVLLDYRPLVAQGRTPTNP